jgi:hypothetical protein
LLVLPLSTGLTTQELWLWLMMQRTCTSISDAAGTASNPVHVSARRFRHRRAQPTPPRKRMDDDGTRPKAAGDLKIYTAAPSRGRWATRVPPWFFFSHPFLTCFGNGSSRELVGHVR